jgi:hypothetical protein
MSLGGGSVRADVGQGDNSASMAAVLRTLNSAFDFGREAGRLGTTRAASSILSVDRVRPLLPSGATDAAASVRRGSLI